MPVKKGNQPSGVSNQRTQLGTLASGVAEKIKIHLMHGFMYNVSRTYAAPFAGEDVFAWVFPLETSPAVCGS